ncbi:LysR family transcriptional regulator [Paroceanicella profunda]|uniref:LysR family transcriptional regulator n=1 Tax=Paroceanicella profunda TaxID=2579971 RepID=A0A5B8FXX7_9RHOB|nr:LysR substrate-binding domain-containing protein [Paroceanicella profunda]QDL93335.1 LysR family transcriptional regulator [Paroceanicella profunda]
MITHRQISAFQEVMRNGSLTAAAEYLDISQPAVSRLIKELEGNVGFALFTRHGARIVPTAAAHNLWEVVERSFLGMDHIRNTAQQIRAGGNTSLSIAAAPVFATTLVPQAIEAVIRTGAPEDISQITITTLPVVRQVALRRADLGVNILTHHQHEVDLIRSYSVPFFVIAAPGHPFGAQQEVQLADLAGVTYIGFDDTTISGQVQNRWFSAMRHGPRITMKCYLASVIRALVGRGLGVSVVDPWTAREHAERGGITRPLGHGEEFRVSLVKPLGTTLSRTGDALVEAIDTEVGAIGR